MTTIFLLVAIFIVLTFYFTKMWFLSELKEKSPDVWESIGKPSPYANNFLFIFSSNLGSRNSEGLSIDVSKWVFVLRVLFFLELTAFLLFGLAILG